MGFNAFDKNRLAALNAEQAEQAAPGGLAPAGPRNDYYIPQWEERTSYGVRRVDPYTKLFEDRIIFLGTPVTDDIANAVMAQLLCLQSMDADRQISMYINSPGGSFTAMTAIYDTMNYVRPDIQTICLGMAASAAAVLLAAGAKGQRLSCRTRPSSSISRLWARPRMVRPPILRSWTTRFSASASSWRTCSLLRLVRASSRFPRTSIATSI